MKKGFTLIEVMIVITIIAILSAVVLPMLATIPQGSRMAQEVGKETLTGENAIENYEWFKAQEEAIKAQYRKEEQAEQSINTYKLDMPECYWDEFLNTKIPHILEFSGVIKDIYPDKTALVLEDNRKLYVVELSELELL